MNRGVALVGVLWRLCEAVLGCVTVVASLAVIHRASAGASGLDGPLRLELVHLLLQAIGHSLSLISAFLCPSTIAFCALLYQSRLVARGLSGWGRRRLPRDARPGHSPAWSRRRRGSWRWWARWR